MQIESDTSTYICSSPEKFAACMQNCFTAAEDNEIWCFLEKEDFPSLSILLKGKWAAVYYFSAESGEMFASFGDGDAKETVVFCGGRFEIIGYQVISAADAMKCALAFFSSQERPDCIEWEEL